LFVFAILDRRLDLAVVSGLFEIAIAFPLNTLVKLRRENVRLQILPDLIELADNADGDEAKNLLAKLVARLIAQI